MMVIFPLYLITLLTLSGCTNKEFKLGWYKKVLPTTITEIKRVYPEINEDKLTCNPTPKPPQLLTKQSEVALFIVNLTIAGKECESNLNYVRMSLDKFRENNTSKGK